jgi:hypothetical protein
MVRLVLALVVLAGCDQLFKLDHLPPLDAGASDGATSDAIVANGHFVHGAFSTSAGGTTIQVTLPSTAAGDLLVVFIGYTGTAIVSTITDSRVDTFKQAGGSAEGNGIGQMLYYAENIAADTNANTITIAFGGNVTGLDVRALEYTQMATVNSLLGAMQNASSGSAQMTSAPLAVAAKSMLVAGFVSNDQVTAPGAGFTERLKTNVGNYAEDREVPKGSYVADATQNNSGAYVVHVAGFATK